jgi:hypothetical protein
VSLILFGGLKTICGYKNLNSPSSLNIRESGVADIFYGIDYYLTINGCVPNPQSCVSYSIRVSRPGKPVSFTYGPEKQYSRRVRSLAST